MRLLSERLVLRLSLELARGVRRVVDVVRVVCRLRLPRKKRASRWWAEIQRRVRVVLLLRVLGVRDQAVAAVDSAAVAATVIAMIVVDRAQVRIVVRVAEVWAAARHSTTHSQP